ncbi:MAG TPA: DMT family transporter [Rhizobiaceae bacterium]|nr:DMT family transporter [Rhizobiaceae bacterium]
MGNVLWPLLGILAGAAFAVQAPVNAALARGLGLPVAAAAVSFFVGAVALALVTALVTSADGLSLQWRAPALWLFIVGGLLGASVVTCSVILAPKIGAAALMACLISGQLLAGIALDRIGFLGLAVREISLGRIAGALLLLAGALMIRIY